MAPKKCCDHSQTHLTKQYPDHSDVNARLNRIAGQFRGVARMVEEKRYCVEILTQLAAIRGALNAVEMTILRKHLSFCVQEAFQAKDPQEAEQKIEELIKLFQSNMT